MTEHDLLDNTTAYDLQYISPLQPTSPIHSNTEANEELSLQEALDDPYIWQHSRSGAREQTEERVDALRTRITHLNRESPLRSNYDARRTRRQPLEHDDDDYSEHCDRIGGEESYASLRRVSAPTPPPFTITTASEEEASDSNDDLPSAAVMADRLRRESRWRAENEHDAEDSPPRFGGLRRARRLDFTAYNEWQERRNEQIEPLRASQLIAPSRILPSSIPHDDSNRIPYHARFFIAKNKSKITIRFPTAM